MINPTLDLADRAAQAVRELNHRTRGAGAFTGPAQLYRLVGELTLLVDGLPQLLGQLQRWLHTEHDAGRIRSDTHTDPGPAVGDAATQLAGAGKAARDLAHLLSGAQQHLAHLGATEPRSTNEDRRRRDKDLAELAADPETGWWDEQGRPAWPDDFFDQDSGLVHRRQRPPAHQAPPGRPPL